MFLTFKALHIISLVAWFAGLFYIVRLFVYLAEAHEQKSASERAILIPQYLLMARRLWFGITWPACIATVSFGTLMLWEWGFYLPGWMHLKLLFVAGLLSYHWRIHQLHARFQQDKLAISSRKARIFNELATLFLVAIVFIVELQDALSLGFAILGLTGFAALLMAGITVYRRVREG